MAAVLKQNKKIVAKIPTIDKNVVDTSSVCRIILDDLNDFREENVETNQADESNLAENNQPSTSCHAQENNVQAVETNLTENNQPSTSCRAQRNNAQVIEPDLIEIVDVENFDKNGLKHPQPNAVKSLISTMNRMQKEMFALKKRVVLLENGQTATASTNIAIAENLQNEQPINIDETDDDEEAHGLFAEDGELDVSALGSFVHNTSFTALESALHIDEIRNMLEIEE